MDHFEESFATFIGWQYDMLWLRELLQAQYVRNTIMCHTSINHYYVWHKYESVILMYHTSINHYYGFVYQLASVAIESKVDKSTYMILLYILDRLYWSILKKQDKMRDWVFLDKMSSKFGSF